MKIKPIEPGMIIHCKTEEEVRMLWKWFNEHGYVRSGSRADSLENMLKCGAKKFSILKEEKTWNTPDHELITHEFSDLIIPEKKQTNADRIRSMSDEELANMLHNNGSYVENGEPLLELWLNEKETIVFDSFGYILEWLQKEVE